MSNSSGNALRAKSHVLSASTAKVAGLIFPWALFLLLWVWDWQVTNPFRQIPAYGDVFEDLWGILWYGEHLFDAQFLHYPLVFYPQGWYIGTFPVGPGLLIPLVPLYKWGGPAFAYNVTVLVSSVLTFAGMYRVAWGLTKSVWASTLAALLFTFWDFRWFRVYGHLGILASLTCLPWMVWSIERALASPRRRWTWFALTGVLWAAANWCGLYFVLIGGLVVIGWIFGRYVTGQLSWRPALKGALVSSSTAALLSAPVIFWFMQANAAAAVPPFSVLDIYGWGASLNSIPIPFIWHPWLRSLAQAIYHGPLNESGNANFGLVASLVALIGLWRIRRDRDRGPILVLTVVGLVLSLGLTLRWDGQSILWSGLARLDSLIWQIGHILKPAVFPSEQPPAPFAGAVPLPGLLLVAVVPLWESLKTFSRYALVAGVGFFLLVSKQAARFQNPWIRLVIGALLVVEIFHYRWDPAPFPTTSHPAFEWLNRETAPRDAIVDLYDPNGNSTLDLPMGGEMLWATQYHERATVAGATSVWPGHVQFLRNWLLAHPHAFQGDQLVSLLRVYDVSYILLHMRSKNEQPILTEAQKNPEIQFVNCFDPTPGPSPWRYPICILKILPSAHPTVNVLLQTGWSNFEPWGVWAEGKESQSGWLASSQIDRHLQVTAFPHCVAGQSQGISIEVRGVLLASHRWVDCEPWSADVLIPAALTQIGWNQVTFRYGYAAEPAVVSAGANADMRMLSVGFTKLEIDEDTTQTSTRDRQVQAIREIGLH